LVNTFQTKDLRDFSNFLCAACILTMWMPTAAWAQSPSDCDGAIVLCGDVYSETEASFNTGAVYEYTGACNQNLEQSSMWYTFTVYEDGLLSFVLDPLDPMDDYDWGLFDITEGGCEGIGVGLGATSWEVGCNSYGVFGANGATGISTANGGTGTSNGPGDLNGPPFNADLPVAQGSSYALVVMNWSNSLNGYTLDFGQSTAVLYDQEAPEMVGLETDCDVQEFVVTFSEPIVVESAEAGDFVLQDPNGGGLAVDAVVANQGGTTSDSFTLTLANPLTVSGTYTLEITDNALFVEDPCGNPGTGELAIDVVVTAPPVGWEEVEVPMCTGEQLSLNATTVVTQPEGDFLNYLWTHDAGNGADIDTVGANSYLLVTEPGLYEVHMTTDPECYEAEGSFWVVEETCHVTVPNVVSPFDTQGTNDRFRVPGLEAFGQASVQIYNRWGGLVYENNQFHNSSGWDPKADGASAGVYHYVLTIPVLDVPLVVVGANGVATPYDGEAPAVLQGALHVVGEASR